MTSNSSVTRLVSVAALVTGLVLVTAAKSQAQGRGHINGYQIDYLYDSGRYDVSDTIRIFGPRGLESIQVTCSPFDWKASGRNSAEWVDSIARAWCF